MYMYSIYRSEGPLLLEHLPVSNPYFANHVSWCFWPSFRIESPHITKKHLHLLLQGKIPLEMLKLSY